MIYTVYGSLEGTEAGKLGVVENLIMESYSGSCRSSDGVLVNINANVDLICAQIASLRYFEPWKMTYSRAWLQKNKDSPLRISCEYNTKYLIMRNGGFG